ncbi:MAG: CynX/NimT family MFS transporter [Rhizobiaceae bacterium]
MGLATNASEATLADAPKAERPDVLVAPLILTGVFAAAQVGKAIICLPDIRAEMHLGLDLAGLIVAVFATLGALGGVGAGAIVARIGMHRSLVGGLSAIAAGNLLGSYAPDATTLLLARVVEGIGFFSVVLSVPSLLAGRLNGSSRNFVMALWSAYMPTGIMLMLFVAPALPAIGWRNLWLADSVLAVAIMAFWWVRLRLDPPTATVGFKRRPVISIRRVVDVLGEKRCLAAAFAFFAYSCQIFSMSFALPQYLTSAHAISVANAGLLSGLILAVSAAGHISSGYLLRAGLTIWWCVAIALLTFSVLSLCIYSMAPSASAAVILAAVSLGVGGLAPGALYASAPHISPAADDIPMTIGLLQQASNLGQFAGPMMVGALAAHFGWSSASFAVVPIAIAGSVACLLLRGAESK